MHRALAAAHQRDHEFATLEHLPLTDDADAAAVVQACKANPGAIKQHLTSYIDSDLGTLAVNNERDTELTTAFHRVVQRAVFLAQDRHQVTGGDLLMARFHETESYAA
jgi:ATP-dependent Clp protease ATP-binding subunit ClpA